MQQGAGIQLPHMCDCGVQIYDVTRPLRGVQVGIQALHERRLAASCHACAGRQGAGEAALTKQAGVPANNTIGAERANVVRHLAMQRGELMIAGRNQADSILAATPRVKAGTAGRHRLFLQAFTSSHELDSTNRKLGSAADSSVRTEQQCRGDKRTNDQDSSWLSASRRVFLYMQALQACCRLLRHARFSKCNCGFLNDV